MDKGGRDPDVYRELVKSQNGWSITSKGHSFIEVVGDANWAKSWGYLLDHVDIWAPLEPRSR